MWDDAMALAEPITWGYGTSFSRKLTALIDDSGQQLNKGFSDRGVFILPPIGGYRRACIWGWRS